MSTLLKNIKKFSAQIVGFFPSALPRGKQEFTDWADSIISAYEPAGTAESVQWSLATMVMRLDPTDARKPKRYFALALHRAAAGEVASYMMREIKESHDARAKAQLEADAQAKQSIEATPPQVAPVESF